MPAVHVRTDEDFKSKVLDLDESQVVWLKSVNGIETKVLGGSNILNNTHITQLEAVRNFMIQHDTIQFNRFYTQNKLHNTFIKERTSCLSLSPLQRSRNTLQPFTSLNRYTRKGTE